MKIAVASDDGTFVTGHVGRCRQFLIFDVAEDGTILNKEVLENTFTHNARRQHDHPEHHDHHEHGGHGHSHSSLVEALDGCSYLIFRSAGSRLVESFKAAGITPICTDETFADLAAMKLVQGHLLIKSDNACNH